MRCKKLKIWEAAERYHDKPDKNEYSHPHDALQYVATKVFGNAVRSLAQGKMRPIEYPKNTIAPGGSAYDGLRSRSRYV